MCCNICIYLYKMSLGTLFTLNQCKGVKMAIFCVLVLGLLLLSIEPFFTSSKRYKLIEFLSSYYHTLMCLVSVYIN